MDKTIDANNSSSIEVQNEMGKKSPSLMQQFKNQIAKIEEKFQNRSSDKTKTMDVITIEDGPSEMRKKEGSASPEPSEPQSKKGMKFGIRVFPPNVNEKLFGKARSKSPPAVKPETNKKDEVKINIDEADGVNTTEVTIECENFNRHNSITSSGIKRDANGIPQELPDFMANAAMAARDGRNKMGSDSDTRKSKGKAPRPPMLTVDLNGSTDTMDTNLNMTDSSINNATANNTNNANMEIEDELDRITEKYLSQSKDKLNFTDNFANSSLLNKTDESVTLYDKIEDLKDDIDDVILRRKEPSNSSTPKSDRKDLNKSFGLESSDLDLSNYGNRMELNSSDVIVHQPNEAEDVCDETRRAASLGDLSLMKKSLTEKDGNSMERAQSLDITDNSLLPKQSLALALSKPTADLSVIDDSNETSPTYPEPKSPKMEMSNGTKDNEVKRTKQMMTNYNVETNVPDDIKVIRYPFGSLERPKSDVLKKILGTPTIQKIEIEQEVTNKSSSTAPSIVFMTPVSNNEGKENVPMTNGNLTSIVTIESQPIESNDKMTVLSVDTSEPPVSLTLVNNTIEMRDPNEMSPIFSSNNMGINSIKISSAEFKPLIVSSTTVIKSPPENNFAGNSAISLIETHFYKHFILFPDNYFIKDNVVTISTDSQPSSIQFIDDVKLDFNMQVLDDLEKDEVTSRNDFKPKIIEAEAKMIEKDKKEVGKTNGNVNDLEINNNVSKTTILNDDDTQDILSNQQMNKFLTEIVFKGDDSAIEDMTASEETATLTSSTMSNASSESSSPNVMTSTKTMMLTNVPLSTANFLKHERRHVEKNFVPQNSEIKFTTAVYEQSNTTNLSANHLQKEPQKRMSQIEQIRQNFEKSAQTASEIPAPIPVARRSSIPLSIQNQKTSPSKIPVFNKQSSKISPSSRTNSYSKLNSSTDSLG